MHQHASPTRQGNPPRNLSWASPVLAIRPPSHHSPWMRAAHTWWTAGELTSGPLAGRRGRGEAGPAAKVLADEPDRDRAFTHRRRGPLYRAAADVPGREHAGRAGLQQVRIAVTAGPRRSVPRVRAEFRAGDDVAAVVQPDGSGQPFGVRFGADQYDQGRGRPRLACCRGEVLE